MNTSLAANFSKCWLRDFLACWRRTSCHSTLVVITRLHQNNSVANKAPFTIVTNYHLNLATKHSDSELAHLCLQRNEIVLEALVFLDVALNGLEVSAELLWNAGVFLLHAGQRVLDVAVEPVEFPGTIQLLITSLHLCQKSLPAIPTSPK